MNGSSHILGTPVLRSDTGTCVFPGWRGGGTSRSAVGSLDSAQDEPVNACLLLNGVDKVD